MIAGFIAEGPSVPCLPSHKLWIWPYCGSAFAFGMLNGISLNPALIIVIICSYHTFIDAHSVHMFTYKVEHNILRTCRAKSCKCSLHKVKYEDYIHINVICFICLHSFVFHHQWMCTNSFCAIMPVLFRMHQSSAL